MNRAKGPLVAGIAGIANLVGAAMEVVMPGRHAGYYVDRIVMRARRANELLNEVPPRTREAAVEACGIGADFGFGSALAQVKPLWSAQGQVVIRSDVLPAATELGKQAAELLQMLNQPDVDVVAAKAKSAAVLSAAEELRTRAYAFDRRPPE